MTETNPADNLLNELESQKKELQSLYKKHESQLSSYEAKIRKIDTEYEKVSQVLMEINKISNFYEEYFDSEKSEEIVKKVNELNELYGSIFNDNEGGVEERINSALDKIEQIDTKFNEWSSEKGAFSTVQEFVQYIEANEPNAKDKILAIKKYYTTLFESQTDEEGEVTLSLKSKIDVLKESIEDIKNNYEAEYNDKLKELNSLHNKIYNKSSSDNPQKGLLEEIEDAKAEINQIKDEAKTLLGAVAKGSLVKQHKDNSEIYAKEYTEAKKHQYKVLCWVIVLYAILLSLILVNIEMWGYNTLTAFVSGIFTTITYFVSKIVGVANTNKILAKKLAEEYNHKCSLTTSVLGYKQELSNEKDSELIERMVESLDRNPSDKINEILKLKGNSPYESIYEGIKSIVSSKGVITEAQKNEIINTISDALDQYTNNDSKSNINDNPNANSNEGED